MAFAYLGPVEIELVQCTEGKIFGSVVNRRPAIMTVK
jgi:hypothetical protein